MPRTQQDLVQYPALYSLWTDEDEADGKTSAGGGG